MHIVIFSDNYRSKNVCHRLQIMFESRVWFMSVLILAMSVDSDDESDGEENVLVSKKQTMDALKTVRSALEQHGGSDEDYDSLYRIQNFCFNSYLGNAKQMKIDDFLRDL